MNIIGTQYSLQHKSLDIYLAGCNGPHCSGCHNPESWDYDSGTPYKDVLPAILTKANSDMVERIFILGGEPLDQDQYELLDLLDKIKDKELWLFTRRELEEIPTKIQRYFSYIKTGRYNSDLLIDGYYCYGVKLASSNQKIFKNIMYI